MHHFRNWLLLSLLLVGNNFLQIFLESPFFDVNNVNISDSTRTSMYIPGAGFSGFFYTLGRLQAFHNSSISSAQEYHCFSAGCLALVISLLRIPVHSVIARASSSRDRWIEGEISRYDVVEDFVDRILSNVHLNAKFEEYRVGNLNVILLQYVAFRKCSIIACSEISNSNKIVVIRIPRQ